MLSEYSAHESPCYTLTYKNEKTNLLEIADEFVDKSFSLDLADHVAVVVIPKKSRRLSFQESKTVHLKQNIIAHLYRFFVNY